MRVYVLARHRYEDFELLGLFTSPEKFQQFVERKFPRLLVGAKWRRGNGEWHLATSSTTNPSDLALDLFVPNTFRLHAVDKPRRYFSCTALNGRLYVSHAGGGLIFRTAEEIRAIFNPERDRLIQSVEDLDEVLQSWGPLPTGVLFLVEELEEEAQRRTKRSQH